MLGTDTGERGRGQTMKDLGFRGKKFDHYSLGKAVKRELVSVKCLPCVMYTLFILSY